MHKTKTKKKRSRIKAASTKSQKYDKILGIPVFGTSRSDLLNDIVAKLANKQKFYIVTPNPEIILASRKDAVLRRALIEAQISINDGIGIALANYYLRLRSSKNGLIRIIQAVYQGPFTLGVFVFGKSSILDVTPVYKGRELFNDLILVASRRRLKVYLIGSKSGVSQNLAKKLRSDYRKIVVKGVSGPMLDKAAKPINDLEMQIYKDMLADIKKYAPHMIFVGLGAPKQEKFIVNNLAMLDSKLMMTVGGTFDSYLQSSKIINFFARIHFEWLGRLIRHPNRVVRISRAVIVFPFFVFLQKIRNK